MTDYPSKTLPGKTPLLEMEDRAGRLSRRLVGGGLLALGLGGLVNAWASPSRAASDPGDQGVAIVMNSAGASFSVIDVASRRVIRTTPVLREPHHWALLPDHSALLIGDTSGNAMFFLDPKTGRVLHHTVFSDPYQLWFSPDHRHLVVAALRVDHVDVYDGATLRLLKRFRLPTMPSHLSYSPDGGRVFVSLQDNGRLVAIDLDRMQVVWDTAIGNTPAGVFFHNDTVLVGDMGNAHVAVADARTGHILRRIPTGRGAHNLFYAPDGKRIYVTNRVEGTISALDAASLDLVRTYHVPYGPDCIAFAPDGHLWVSQRWGGHVAVLDPTTDTYQAIAVGRSPHGIFLSASPTLPSPLRPAVLTLSTP